jgi:hypothetical protein
VRHGVEFSSLISHVGIARRDLFEVRIVIKNGLRLQLVAGEHVQGDLLLLSFPLSVSVMVMSPHAQIPSATPLGLENVKLLRRNKDANALFAHFKGDLLRTSGMAHDLADCAVREDARDWTVGRVPLEAPAGDVV